MSDIWDYICFHYSDKTAVVYQNKEITFGYIQEMGNSFGQGHVWPWTAKGAHLGILTPNCLEVVLVDYACAKLGLVRVPLAAYLGTEDILYILRDTKVTGLVYHAQFKNHLAAIKTDIKSLEYFIRISEEESPLPKGEYDLQQLIDQTPFGDWDSPVTPDDLFTIAYTGGTTGVPKGVMHSHRTWTTTIFMELLEWDIGRDEVCLLITPMTHAAGLLAPAVWLRGGSAIILKGFDAQTVFEMIETKRVTTAFVVPTIIYALLDFPERDKYDTSSLRNLIYGAAPIAPERLKEAVQAFGPVFTQLYGQAEGPNALVNLSREEHVISRNDTEVSRLASCGRPSPVCPIQTSQRRKA